MPNSSSHSCAVECTLLALASVASASLHASHVLCPCLAPCRCVLFLEHRLPFAFAICQYRRLRLSPRLSPCVTSCCCCVSTSCISTMPCSIIAHAHSTPYANCPIDIDNHLSLTPWSYYFPVDVGLSNNFGPTVADLGLLGFLCVGWLMIDSGLLSVSGFARAYVASHVYL